MGFISVNDKEHLVRMSVMGGEREHKVRLFMYKTKGLAFHIQNKSTDVESVPVS